MEISRIEIGLESETAGGQLVSDILESINGWLEDKKIDSSELNQASQIEKALRNQIDAKLIPGSDATTPLLEKYPGAAYVLMAWLKIASLLTMVGVKTNPVEVSGEVQEFLGTPASRFAIGNAAAFDMLSTVSTARALAAIVFLGFPDDGPALSSLTKCIRDSDAELGARVLEFQSAMWGLSSSGPGLSTVAEEAQILADAYKKKYKSHYRELSEEFLGEGFVDSILVSDSKLKSVELIFGDKHIAISPEGKGITYISRGNVTGILIASRTERMHTGFNSTDYHKWSVSIHVNDGSIHQFNISLGTNNEDLNPRRQRLTKTFRTVGDYYPVSSSGTHSFSESGYKSSIIYRF